MSFISVSQVGGAVKRLAAQASLRMVYKEQIMTPRQLNDWSKENITNISFIYLTKEHYEHEKTLMKTRLEEAITVKGTQQYKPKNATSFSKNSLLFKLHQRRSGFRK
ncbi:unnamed protein product [Euphydryas editha]|uniref:Uncharacterized protein n=1 Tax=Euphydryas editha TaxID=104508 RepID=A0AAU9UZ37_EUPED|nr:unnamed protein product [Euphydryas editha]